MKLKDIDVENWESAVDALLFEIDKVREVSLEYYKGIGSFTVNEVIEFREKMLAECDNISHASVWLESIQPHWGYKLNKAKELALDLAVKERSTKTEAREVYRSQDVYADVQLTYDIITNTISAGKNVVKSTHKLTDGMSHKTKDHSYTNFSNPKDNNDSGSKSGKRSVFG